MSERSLWLTYRKTEQVSEIMTTPRESQNPDKKPFLRRKSNPLIQSAGPKHENQYLDVRATQEFQSSKLTPREDRFKESPGTRMSTQQATPNRKTMAPNKYTITTNNKVSPNFQSMAYQEDAREAHKRRMAYNPLEASKNKLRVSHPISKYALDEKVSMEQPPFFSRNMPNTSPLCKSMVNARPSRYDDPLKFTESRLRDPKLSGFTATSNFMLFGEKFSINSRDGVKEMTSVPLSKSRERPKPTVVKPELAPKPEFP